MYFFCAILSRTCIKKAGDSPHEIENNLHCWECSFPCHALASCVSSDFCKCNDDYVGDGFFECIPKKILPKIVNISQQELSFNSNSELNIFIDNEVTNGYVPYIKIDDIIIKCSSWGKKLSCFLPLMEKGKFPVFVSFNAKYWTPSDHYLVFH